MKQTFENAWFDLRQKRLLPVAALLLVALIAIPVFLLKPAEGQEADAPALVTPGPQNAATQFVESQENVPGTGSNLGVFDPKDPFQPDADVRPKPGDGIAEVVVEEEPSAPAGGDEVAVIGPDVEIVEPGPAPGPAPAPRRVTRVYEYVVDVTYWGGDGRRAVRGLRKLDMLPNESAPLLIFMGVANDGGNATFLVDSSLDASGEGNCKPSRDDCALVSIGPGAEEMFTDDQGATYRMRVDEIRKVPLKAGASNRAQARSSAQTPRGFLSLLLPDEIVETETVAAEQDSSRPANGR
jgi:hypothetical protein